MIANSFFITSVGGEQWSKLNFWIQSLTIAIFISFIFARDKRSYEIYAGVLLLIAISSVGLFVWEDSHLLVYGMAALVLTSDLLGNMVNNNILAGIFSRAVLRDLDQSVIPADLAGRLVGAGMIELASYSGLSQHFHYLLWALVFLHACFFIGIVRFWGNHRRPEHEDDGSTNELGHIGMNRVVRYALTSTIVQVSLLFMIWNQCVKYLTQALYFSAANHLQDGLKDTSQFLSQINIITIVVTYLFQQLLGRKLVDNKSMGYLFRFMPIGFLCLAAATLVFDVYWTIVLQFIFFTVVNKVINAPMTRQYLFLIPKPLRGKSYILITVIASFFLILISGATAIFEEYIGLSQLMVSLVVVSVLILLRLAYFNTEEEPRTSDRGAQA